jgi:outer membrane protein TolC
MGNATPFSVQQGDPSSYRSVGAMQMLPYPGKLRLKGEIAGKEMEAGAADYEAVRRKVASQAKATFFDYFYYDKALQVALKDKNLLQQLSKISEARYRVGKAMQQDVLKSQTEISMLLQKITILEQQRAVAQARLNLLMARSPESPLPPAADVALTPSSRSLEELYQLAEKNSPMLQREQRLVERNQIAVSLAEKEYRPDLSVGFMYQQRPDLPDMKGATFTINVPIFYRGKQREGVRQAEEEVIAAQKSREDRANETRFELKQAYLAAKAAKDLADLYTKAVVPQSSLTLESSMSAYQVGSNDFLTVLSNFSTLLNYETDYYRQVADYNMALAEMESMVGVELVPAQAVKQ